MAPAEESLARLLGARVRARRAALEWSQAVLAEQIGTSVEYVSMLERGARLPSLPTLIALAGVLSMSLDDLAGPVEDEADVDADVLEVAARSVPAPLRGMVARMLLALAEPVRGGGASLAAERPRRRPR